MTPRRRTRLFSFELAWTDAAFDAIHPDHPALPHGVKSMHPARFFQSMLFGIPLEQSIGLRVALWMVALAPLFTIRKLGTIASIGAGDRRRVLEALLASPIYAVRGLALMLKASAALLYGQSAAVRAAMTTPRRAAEGSGGVVALRLAKDAPAPTSSGVRLKDVDADGVDVDSERTLEAGGSRGNAA